MATTEFFTEEYLADLAADGFAPAPARRPAPLVADDFYTEEYVQAVLADLAEAAARQALAPEPDGGDDPDGGPAPAPAAPSARPVRPFSVATWTGAPVYLTAEELAEWDAFERAAGETWDPLPCDGCGRPASPGVETDEGRTLCLACGEGPDAPPAARAAVRQWRFAASCRRLAAARLARQAAGVA